MANRSKPHREPFLEALRQSADRLGLRGRRVLLAVSGGKDSVSMLLGFSELAETLGLTLGAATIDHRLRPGSAGDVAYVRRLARRLGVRFFTAAVEVGHEGGLEAAARQARYRALHRIARSEGFELVATAHTRDDQAETVLLRLARGTGTRGLRGILARRPGLVRPLLAVSRDEVEAFLRRRRIRARLDPTNASDAHDRNRVRSLVLPALVQALGPSAVESLARAAEVAADDERYLERRAAAWARRHLAPAAAGGVEADAARLAGLPRALRRRVLRRAAAAAGVSLEAHHVARALAALTAAGPARVGLPDGFELVVRYGRLTLAQARRTPAPEPFDHPIAGEGRHHLAGVLLTVRPVQGPGPARAGCLRIDPARVRLPLRLRSRRPGDRFRPRGGRTRKLKAFLIDQKVPRELRDGLPLLADSGGRILALLGNLGSLGDLGIREADAAEDGERAERAWEIEIANCPGASPADPLELAIPDPRKAENRQC